MKLIDRRAILQGFAGILAGTPWCRTAAAASLDTPIIAAASTLRFCLGDIAKAFAAAGGGSLRLTFGSSGNLARQVEQGAPFALFMSADENYALRLVQAGFAPDNGALYAIGRLALIARKGGPIGVDAQLKGLRAAQRSGRLHRFAIANPAHAPYGMRAREALIHAGLWRPLQPRLVLGENVAQAAQYAETGAAEAGLVASALALSPRIARKLNTAIIPDSWHNPLRQRMVLLKAGSLAQNRQARAFYDFLQGAGARRILQRAGFSLPAL